MEEIVRKGDERSRGVLARPRTYSVAEEGEGWLTSHQVDRLHPAQKAWVEEKALYPFAARNEEWAWGEEKPQPLTDQGGRSVAHIVATSSGLHAKDAPGEIARCLARETYICRGARCMISFAVWQ